MTEQSVQTVTRSTTHSTFVIERTFPQSPERVFHAFTDRGAKLAWFVLPEELMRDEYQFDFRVGGQEVMVGGPPDGPVFTYRATFYDIVPNERIITGYEMHMGDARISVSVATVELTADGDGTRLVLTEQGAFLDGLDTVEAREHGTRALLDSLAASLAN
jgi:uncharacterized protein YndB with AHSA1/START domain